MNKYGHGANYTMRYKPKTNTCCTSRVGGAKKLFKKKPTPPEGYIAYQCRVNEGWHVALDRKKKVLVE